MNQPKNQFGIQSGLRAALAGILSLAFLLSSSATNQVAAALKPENTIPNPHLVQDLNQEPMKALDSHFFRWATNSFLTSRPITASFGRVMALLPERVCSWS